LIRHIQLCVRQAGEYSSEALNVKKDGSLFDAEITGTSFNYGESAHLLVTVRDISERKWAEEELKLTNQQLRVSEQALREREARLRAIFQGSAIGIVLSDLSGRPIESNQAFQHMLGYSTMTLRQMTFTQYIHPDDRQASLDIFQDLVQGKCDHYKIEQRYIRKDQSINWVRMTASLIRNESGTPDYVIKIIEDISQRKATEESYRQSETKYKYLFENLLDAFAYHRIIYDSENTPVDYVFLEVNNAFEQITGLKRLDIIGKKVSEILPDIKKRIFNWIEAFEKVEASGSAIKFEKYSEPLNRWFLVSAYSPEKGYFVTIIEDITDRRLIEEEIRSFATELECSNRQLELFAHTVSSDFQEHLRSVSHGATSLAQQYAGKLDPKANELIQCMTQKTERMEIMLADLLLYSKLACRGNPFESIDLNDLVLCIIKDLDETIKKTHSTIITEPLPTIQGDRNQIGQMFEKIIDNAIKFRSNEPLKITIESKENTSNWEIIITDNGIGIDPDQHERIFDIFYCLHSQNVYPGTGMGLPVSKKIVERHGGKIWLDSQVGQGSKFYLSLPKPTLHSL
ncbi:MAG: PAS domain S-box protein, partial [Phycisphaerae bacterium]|nr:PAS domain S-box protein [Phycisphaerae bacterium]